MSSYIIKPPKTPAMATPKVIRPHRISPRASRPALAPVLSVAVELAAVPVAVVEPVAAVPEALCVAVAEPIEPPPVDWGALESSESAAALAKASKLF